MVLHSVKIKAAGKSDIGARVEKSGSRDLTGSGGGRMFKREFDNIVRDKQSELEEAAGLPRVTRES